MTKKGYNAGMGQEQRQVVVKMLNGDTREAAATGNNAAWHCACGYELPLVGRTYESTPKPNQVVQCPNSKCGKFYHLYPENGEDKKRVEFVQECEKPD